MRAFKLGVNARMALNWGSSRWAVKLGASKGIKDEEGIFTLMVTHEGEPPLGMLPREHLERGGC